MAAFFPGQTGGSPILKVSMIYPCPDMMHQVKDWINSVSSLVLVSRRAKHVRQDLAGGGGVGWGGWMWGGVGGCGG